MKEQKKLNINLGFLDKENSVVASKEKEKQPAKNIKIDKDKVHQVRPWIRYWARYMDLMIFSIFFGIFLFIFFPSILEKSNVFLTVLILFVWIFVESILLSSWGSTPGKWLLKIDIKDNNDNKPTFSTALNRSFIVWFKGLGFGIPIVSIFTLVISYNQLTKNGITSWDRDVHFKITHKKIGVLRTVIAIIIFIVTFSLIALGES